VTAVQSAPPNRPHSSISPLLELRSVTKRFPGCLANDQVDLVIKPGEIHALLGENGAGKSTLVKMIYGLLQADEGDILWEADFIKDLSPATARTLGIGMVFQHFSLFEAMTVLENIALSITDPRSLKDLRGDLDRVGQKYGLPLAADRPVHSLSVGEKQRIEIVRCLLQDPKLLILDEPTSVLTPQEADRLFETLRALADQGCAILYISHKLEEVKTLCHAATILRQGKVVETCDPRQETAKSLAEKMIGEKLTTPKAKQTQPRDHSPLQVSQLSLDAEEQFGVSLKEICFSVQSTEIFGIAGVAGNGQNELMAALIGERLSSQPETIQIEGVMAGKMDPIKRRALGAAFVPEERNGHGAVPQMSLRENAFLTAHHRLSLCHMGLIKQGATLAFTQRILQNFDVRSAGDAADACSLSGGNLQKFIVGREILQNPSVLIVSQPTWGVDAGAAAVIHQALLDLAASGAAIVVISQDLEEILMVCDSVAVMSEGRLSPAKATKDVTTEALGLLMGGYHEGTDPATALEGRA